MLSLGSVRCPRRWCDAIVIMKSWCEANKCCSVMLWQGACSVLRRRRRRNGVALGAVKALSMEVVVSYHVKIRRENVGANLYMCAPACVRIMLVVYRLAGSLSLLASRVNHQVS